LIIKKYSKKFAKKFLVKEKAVSLHPVSTDTGREDKSGVENFFLNSVGCIKKSSIFAVRFLKG
jgi:hypothetical protein